MGGSTTTSSSSPWGPQAAGLQTGFNNAANVYAQDAATGPYTGQFYAPMNANQLNVGNMAYNSAMGMNGLPGAEYGAGMSLLGGVNPMMNAGTSLATNGIGMANPALTGVLSNYATGGSLAATQNPALSSALNANAINAANTLGTAGNNLSTITGNLMSNPTGNTMGIAQGYYNSAPVQQQQQSADALINQTLQEQTLPGLNQQASMGGSLNSSRAGMAEAMANQGAALAMGQTNANIAGNAFNTALGTAASQNTAANNAAISAASSGMWPSSMFASNVGNQQLSQSEANANAQLGAANSGLSQNLGYAQAGANAQLGGAGLLGNAANLGLNANSTAVNSAGGLANLGMTGAAVPQQAAQLANQNALSQFQMNTQYPWQNLQNYMGALQGNYGQNTTSTQQQSTAGDVLGGIGALASIAAVPMTGGMSLAGLAMSGLAPSLMGGGNTGSWNNITNG